MRKRNGKKDKHWQHEDTGAVCISWYRPSKRWYRITHEAYKACLASQSKSEPVLCDGGNPGA